MKIQFRAMAAVAALALAAWSQDDLSTWSSYKSVTVNTQAGGANVAADVTNFPVLVRLTEANANDVFTQALPGGADIRFANLSGTQLPYEIEHWDATAKTASIWVLADVVQGNSNTASMRMYWGRSGVASASNGAAVFDTANGYVAVWHMNGTDTEVSSTAHGFVATPNGAPGANASAAIGAGRTFDGSQYFRVVGSAASAMDMPADGQYTLSAWVRADSVVPTGGTGHGIINKGDHQWTLATYSGNNQAPNRWYEITTKANNTWNQTTTAPTTNPAYAGLALNEHIGTWRYVTGTWNGTTPTAVTARIFVDGNLEKTTTPNITTHANGMNAARSTARDVHIGSLSNQGATSTEPTGAMERYWIGSLDEIRVSNVVRDSSWIRLEFETQKPGANAVTLGATQTQTVTPTAITNVRYQMPGTGNTPRDTLVFEVGTPVHLPLLYDGGPADSAKLTGNNVTLPAGLSINLTTGLLSGTPTAVFAAGNRTLTVYGAAGNVTRGLRISVLPAATADFSYAQDTVEYIAGIAIAGNAPTWTGRAPTSFSASPALPAGLSLNQANGSITGTPTAVASATNHTITAANATDTVTAVVRITVTSVASEDYAGTAWPHKQQLWLNTQSNGANVDSLVTNFPVLIRLDSSNFNTGFTQTAASGADIRFTKLNNTTRLPHQIERWDATAKQAEVWVLVDSIVGQGVSSIRMHWGNATAPNLSSGASVFGSSNGFQAVWHMSAPEGNEMDASTNGFSAVANNAPGSAPGVIGHARTFNGTNQFFVAPNTASGPLNFQQTDSYTLSAWIHPNAISQEGNTGHKVIDKGDNQYVLATYGSGPDDRFWEITIRGNNTWNQCQSDGSFGGHAAILASSSVGGWHHLVGTYTGGAEGASVTQRLYFNGVLINVCEIMNESAQGRNENHNVHIGVQSGAAPSGTYTRHWNGLMDEVRLANQARSPSWVKLEFQNQRAAQTLVSFTEPEEVVAIGTLAARGAGNASLISRPLGSGIHFSLQGIDNARATLTLVDMWGRTVWTGNFTNGELVWTGRTKGGSNAASGVYLARVTVRDVEGKATMVLDRRVPFTR